MKDILWSAVSNQGEFRRLINSAAHDLNQGNPPQLISQKLAQEMQSMALTDT
jgi:hypothetical protein